MQVMALSIGIYTSSGGGAAQWTARTLTLSMPRWKENAEAKPDFFFLIFLKSTLALDPLSLSLKAAACTSSQAVKRQQGAVATYVCSQAPSWFIRTQVLALKFAQLCAHLCNHCHCPLQQKWMRRNCHRQMSCLTTLFKHSFGCHPNQWFTTNCTSVIKRCHLTASFLLEPIQVEPSEALSAL